MKSFTAAALAYALLAGVLAFAGCAPRTVYIDRLPETTHIVTFRAPHRNPFNAADTWRTVEVHFDSLAKAEAFLAAFTPEELAAFRMKRFEINIVEAKR